MSTRFRIIEGAKMKSEEEVRALLKKAQEAKLPNAASAEVYREAVIDVLAWVLGETHGPNVADEFENRPA
jgi:hypothetical protein